MIQLRSTIDNIKLSDQWEVELKLFLQMQMNRLIIGSLRFGEPKKKTKFMTRIEKELAVYKRTGNAEQLINIANYAALEFYAPENKKFHFDPTAESATRGEMGC